MDPQHGLLLEVSREASENAALVPQKLIGSRTGICVGIMTNNYMHLSKCAASDAWTKDRVRRGVWSLALRS